VSDAGGIVISGKWIHIGGCSEPAEKKAWYGPQPVIPAKSQACPGKIFLQLTLVLDSMGTT
jgi:hypothetical protein